MNKNKTNKKIQYFIIPSIAIVWGVSVLVGYVNAETFSNPIGYDNVNDLLGKVLTTVQGIVAALAVLMLVVGGVIYITSAGNSGQVELAKKAITAALIGLALTLAAPAFLKEIYEVTGAGSSGVDTPKTLSQMITKAIQVVVGLVGSLSVLMIVVGGVMYMTSAGDTTRADSAKNIIKYAIIGLLVAIGALLIVTQVAKIMQ